MKHRAARDVDEEQRGSWRSFERCLSLPLQRRSTRPSFCLADPVALFRLLSIFHFSRGRKLMVLLPSSPSRTRLDRLANSLARSRSRSRTHSQPVTSPPPGADYSSSLESEIDSDQFPPPSPSPSITSPTAGTPQCYNASLPLPAPSRRPRTYPSALPQCSQPGHISRSSSSKRLFPRLDPVLTFLPVQATAPTALLPASATSAVTPATSFVPFSPVFLLSPPELFPFLPFSPASAPRTPTRVASEPPLAASEDRVASAVPPVAALVFATVAASPVTSPALAPRTSASKPVVVRYFLLLPTLLAVVASLSELTLFPPFSHSRWTAAVRRLRWRRIPGQDLLLVRRCRAFYLPSAFLLPL